MDNLEKSRTAYQRACRVIPGGVNSPVRAFGAVGGEPLFIERGDGAHIYDIDGNEYIDYVLSWGPMILGHAHPAVVEAVRQTTLGGTSFGAPTVREIELAELVIERMPFIDKLRLVNSGTEAVMTAVRLARGFTGRDTIIKFDGCYHGHSDGLLVKAGSGLAAGGIPGTRGIPAGIAASTLSLPYNNADEVERVFREKGEAVAAVLVEPVAANMGVVSPRDGFLEKLRTLTSRHGAVLIFDEVITGFRVSKGGASGLFDIVPDLLCLGKILGGGMPIGGVGGKKEIMDMLAPSGDIYQAGTLSGNPLSVAAGIATLTELGKPGVYERLNDSTERLASESRNVFSRAGIDAQINTVIGMLTVFFSSQEVKDFQTAQSCDDNTYRRFFQAMLKEGIYLPPSPFESWFMSIKHNREILEKTVSALQNAIKSL